MYYHKDHSHNHLDYSRNYNRPEMSRYEYADMRMGKSLFEDKAMYDRNSPVVHAAAIRTPLLMWTGAEDIQVNPQQSIEMHLALKRLKKQSILLVYSGEGHTLHGRQSQCDLTLKFEQWFDYYLNDGEKPK